MTGCDSFKEFTFPSCPDAFKISASLMSSTHYGWEFKDKFSNKYVGEAVTDEDGLLSIDIDDPLSKDMFHFFSNALEFRLYNLFEEGSRLQEKFCDTYDYLLFSFEETNPLPDPNNAIISLCE
jgi:hypothetical protein